MIRLRFNPNAIADLTDPRELPTYSIPLAAHYVRVPVSTLRSWVKGRYYDTSVGKQKFSPLIVLPDPKLPLLSFLNLAEAHVLSAFRKYHKLRLDTIRRALKYVSKELGAKHPLLDVKFQTDGLSLFFNRLGHLVEASAYGQLAIREVLNAYLERIEREDSEVVRLFPFTRPDYRNSPRSVFIDPRFSFGRPVLAHSRIPTGILAERYMSGDSMEHLAKDYRCAVAEVEEAVRCELRLAETE
jgi:uncharacterized protein (DUF433 family)